MTITAQTAIDLDALGDELAVLTGGDPAYDARMFVLIVPVMWEIENRTPSNPNARFTLNITNALVLRAKKWYMKSAMELGQPNQPFCSIWFEYVPVLGYVQGGTGTTKGAAALGPGCCAAICHVWAEIVRRHLADNYPSKGI